MTVSTIRKDQEYILTIHLAKILDRNPALQFPLVIDPEITVCQGTTGIEHAMVYSGYPTTTNLCSTLNETRHTIGYYDSARKVGIELIRFPGLYQSSTFFSGGFISNVTYHQYFVPSSITPTVKAYLYDAAWSPSTVTYQSLSKSTNNLIENSISFPNSSGTSPMVCTLDLTEYVWYWKHESTSRAKGLILKNDNTTNSNYCAIFMANEVQATQYYYYSPYVTMECTTKKIMLDAGHFAGQNQSPVYSPYYEGTQMWVLQSYLQQKLKKYGFEIGTTRSSNTDLSLDSRGAKAEGYDMFLSLHSNASNTANIDRVDVYYDVNNKNNAKNFAEIIGSAVKNTMGVAGGNFAKTRELENQPGINYYGVLRAAATTNCPLYYIIEHSFHTNYEAAVWLSSDENLQKLAEAEAFAIANFYKGR